MKIKAKVIRTLDILGLGVFEPVIHLVTGESPKEQIQPILKFIILPVFTLVIAVGVWWVVSRNIKTETDHIPGPQNVFVQFQAMHQDHVKERQKEAAFYRDKKEKVANAEQQVTAYKAAIKSGSLNGAALTDVQLTTLKEKLQTREDKLAAVKKSRYGGTPTYIDQIYRSLLTVFAGFIIAIAIAIPIGILCGLNRTCNSALNLLIQILKPVSPVAWLPIVAAVVGALYTIDPPLPFMTKAFLASGINVALCALWPTLINTAQGVASIDKDHLNVARVLKLSLPAQIFKIVLPSSLPMMFTGMRISLGVGWMVLIATDMLSGNPGLGKFVWDMFQNNNMADLAKILCAVLIIGVIGFGLDRIMVVFQRLVTFDKDQVIA